METIELTKPTLQGTNTQGCCTEHHQSAHKLEITLMSKPNTPTNLKTLMLNPKTKHFNVAEQPLERLRKEPGHFPTNIPQATTSKILAHHCAQFVSVNVQ